MNGPIKMNRQNKVILFVGVSGIGRKLYTVLPSLGFKSVLIVYKNNRAAAETFLNECHKLDLTGEVLQADVTNSDSVKLMIEQCTQSYGNLDAVVAMQGGFLQKLPTEYSEKEILSIFSDNVFANYYLAQYSLPYLRDTSGSLIFFGVAHADQLHSQIHTMPYSAAKSALYIFMRTLARSEATHHVRVNMISPGLMQPLDSITPTSEVPMKRYGTPDDLIETVRFLLSDQSEYCTGTNIILSGGWAL